MRFLIFFNYLVVRVADFLLKFFVVNRKRLKFIPTGIFNEGCIYVGFEISRLSLKYLRSVLVFGDTNLPEVISLS